MFSFSWWGFRHCVGGVDLWSLPRRAPWGERRRFATGQIPLPPGIHEVLPSAKDGKSDMATEFPLRAVMFYHQLSKISRQKQNMGLKRGSKRVLWHA